jgi:hypothetical protein
VKEFNEFRNNISEEFEKFKKTSNETVSSLNETIEQQSRQINNLRNYIKTAEDRNKEY